MYFIHIATSQNLFSILILTVTTNWLHCYNVRHCVQITQFSPLWVVNCYLSYFFTLNYQLNNILQGTVSASIKKKSSFLPGIKLDDQFCMTSPAYSCIFSLNCISEQSRGNEWESCGLQLLLPLRMFITFCAEQLFLEISRTCAPQRIECPWPSELDPKMLLLLCKMPNASFLRHLLLQKPMTLLRAVNYLKKLVVHIAVEIF